MEFPFISIITPTLNSERTIKECLRSIFEQDYPKEKLEVLIIDGGSKDNTLSIVRSFDVRIIPNPLKTGESAKAKALKESRGDILVFIDSDNILPEKNWLRKMIEPFKDREITASEPIRFTYRNTDSYITRYCALMGLNDPLCFFLGNYDRYNTLTGVWTNLSHKEEDKGEYIKVTFEKKSIPTIGANGFLIRKEILNNLDINDYLFDVDIIGRILDIYGYVKIAKVKTGIVHIYCANIKDFVRKQKRRINDYLYFRKKGLRKYNWSNISFVGFVRFVISTILVIPLIVQAVKGFLKRRDISFFFHIPSCLITLYIYSVYFLLHNQSKGPLNREQWIEQ